MTDNSGTVLSTTLNIYQDTGINTLAPVAGTYKVEYQLNAGMLSALGANK